jgi:hypothetical protein
VRRIALAVLALAACSPRVEVVDAVSGQAVVAQVVELAGGRLLVEANGYETWSGPATGTVQLQPLWQTRFMERGESQRQPAPPCAGCPGRHSR